MASNGETIAVPIEHMTPHESSDAGGLGALAGSRPSSEIDAYGGNVCSPSCVCMHPPASAIAPHAIAAARIAFHRPDTGFVLCTPVYTVTAASNRFNAF